jgi:sporulation related protein
LKRLFCGRKRVAGQLALSGLLIGVFILVAMPAWGEGPGADGSKGPEARASREAGVADATYQLQLNSFKVQSNAKRFFDWLVKKGYKPFMVFVDEGEPWFKVRMGPYPSKDAATLLAAELKEKHGLSSLILLTDNSGPVASDLPARKKKIAVKKVKAGLSTQKTASRPTMPESVAPENTGSPIDVVLSQFLVWLKAWEKKRLDSYFSFYSKSFESGGKPFNDWQRLQRESLEKIHQIKIEVDDLEMLEKADTVEISFVERYQSDVYSDIRRKTLVWKKEKGRWRIIAESTEPA